MRLITLGLGAALGYLLGSAEGRKNLEKMTQNAQKLWNLSLIHISEPTRQCCTSRMPSSA